MHVPPKRLIAGLFLLMMFCSGALWAQTPALATDSNGVKPAPVAAAKDTQSVKKHAGPITDADREYELKKARDLERIERIRKDAARLLETATELKKYVDNTNENVLSLEIVRKAVEMEKLARDLKNSMKAE